LSFRGHTKNKESKENVCLKEIQKTINFISSSQLVDYETKGYLVRIA